MLTANIANSMIHGQRQTNNVAIAHLTTWESHVASLNKIVSSDLGGSTLFAKACLSQYLEILQYAKN